MRLRCVGTGWVRVEPGFCAWFLCDEFGDGGIARMRLPCGRRIVPCGAGCVLFEMMTKRHPFEAQDINGLMKKVRTRIIAHCRLGLGMPHGSLVSGAGWNVQVIKGTLGPMPQVGQGRPLT